MTDRSLVVNYFADEKRSSPLNLAVARVILAGYLIWKTVWYDWSRLLATPFVVSDSYAFLVPPSPTLLVAEKWVLIGLLVGVALGYRLGVTTFSSALVVAHLGAVRYTVNTSGGTTALFFAVYFLLIFGLYRDQDVLTLDGFRRSRRHRPDGGTATRESEIGPIASVLPSFVDDRGGISERDSYPMTALKWNLVVIAVVYFGSGVDKLLEGGLAWVAADNLSRILLVWDALYTNPFSLGPVLLSHPVLVSAAAIGTLILEIGFIVAVLSGVTITPFVVGIVGMQGAIAVTLGPFFFDVFVFFAMFVAWDTLSAHLLNWLQKWSAAR